ncbi:MULTISPECIES: SAM-dependent methyltransferase [unclassified Pseudofrankia]|uniref:SAM-dependent methyltransferase n=1 Tax=unclassified Pseudofrankia TaxID=2994372 RepID=UPI0008DB2150|nr:MULTISPECIES: SAM-dependent methyltransferase [unclassified Pseudofrankia]MDT3446747.1 SAM-dependent methyltransferase [Pseudofrankia sp. BMG5.37]OHV59189.1 S-adenosyl methyltransferase [Pseudofrankia sp. BMG5.36]
MNDGPPPTLDITKPHSARVWNYFLGGKDYYPADREFAEQVYESYPEIIEVARAARAFLGRAVRYLAGEAGIRQFLDIGTGLPTADNTHEVAQRTAPESRIVYVDNDPLVLVHARALLASAAEGATAYIEADVHDPDKILTGAANVLDFSKPIAVMLLGVMGNVADLDEAYRIVASLRDALPSGSYIAVQDGTHIVMSEEARTTQALSNDIGYGYQLRTPEQIAGFLDGLELVEPGVVSSPLWRPDPNPARPPAKVDEYCGIGRKR